MQKSSFSYASRPDYPEYMDGKVPSEHKLLVDRDILFDQKEAIRRIVSETERVNLNSRNGIPSFNLGALRRDLKMVLRGLNFVSEKIVPRIYRDGVYATSLQKQFNHYLSAIERLDQTFHLFHMNDVAEVLNPSHPVNPTVN